MADQESQVWPLAPAKLHQSSYEVNPKFKAIRRERSNKCFFYVFAAIVTVCMAFLIFALLVLRVKAPAVKLRSVAVKNLKYSSSPLSFNATLSVHMTVKNPNFGNYRFEPNTVSFLYGGSKVGSSKLRKGEAGAKKTGSMNFLVDVRSNRLPEGANNLTSDINSGMLRLSGTGKVSGRVRLWKMNKKTSGRMDCTMTLVLKSSSIKDLVCR